LDPASTGHRGELGQPFAAVHDAGATGTRPAAPARLLQAKQQQQIPEQARSPAAAESTSKTSSHSRHLQQQLGPVYADVPGDVLDLNSILAAARDAFTVFEPSLLPPQYGRPRYVPRAASHALTGFNGRNLAGGGANLAVTFRASHPDVELRLPGLPRSFNLTVSDASGTQQACKHTNRAYADQDLVCGGLQPGVNWLATLVDAGEEGGGARQGRLVDIISRWRTCCMRAHTTHARHPAAAADGLVTRQHMTA
jgi:hypothetical protein